MGRLTNSSPVSGRWKYLEKADHRRHHEANASQLANVGKPELVADIGEEGAELQAPCHSVAVRQTWQPTPPRE